MKTTTFAAALALAVTSAFSAMPATAQQKVTYLFPAPNTLPAFVPFQVARHKGYYKDEGLDVNWQIGKGGADVARQVGVGNADLGGGIGDTAIIVRANGIEVRGVALLGGKTLTQIIARTDRGINSFADLKGKKIGVLAFQDTTFYNLLGVLRSAKIGRDDANVQAVGPAGMVQLMISGDLDAISGTPDWAHNIQSAGIKIRIFDTEAAFPAMAQAIIASDKTIKERPDMVRRFVRATLKGLRETMGNPEQAARDFVAAVPQHAGKEKAMEEIIRSYGQLVYKTDNMATLGQFDAQRLAAVQKFYVDNQIVQKAVPIKETYTNEFIGK